MKKRTRIQYTFFARETLIDDDEDGNGNGIDEYLSLYPYCCLEIASKTGLVARDFS